jgi:hypothetical protein
LAELSTIFIMIAANLIDDSLEGSDFEAKILSRERQILRIYKSCMSIINNLTVKL